MIADEYGVCAQGPHQPSRPSGTAFAGLELKHRTGPALVDRMLVPEGGGEAQRAEGAGPLVWGSG